MRYLAGVLTLWAVAFGAAAYGDQVSTVLLALADITTVDGQVIEVVAPISRGLPGGEVTADGFYVVRKRFNGKEVHLPYLFNDDFVWLEPDSARRRLVSTGLHGEIPGLYKYRTHYLRDVTGGGQLASAEREDVQEEDGQRLLVREKVYRSRHEMLDYVPAYEDVLAALQGECYPSTGSPAPAPTRIPLVTIVRFRLVHAPSTARLDALRAASGYWTESITDTEPAFYGHTWYHDVVAPEPQAEWRFRPWEMTR
ncbi:MAG: hypothetical protein ABGY41_22950 [Candidatus Poribacteria bacterium]